MSRRISLTRVIALNWYGFRQIFDVQDNVLISGAFGTGKSALLDLMQYVLLGEHWRANRAAAGNARGRDLVGYCLGDTNQTRQGQRHFLRPSGVTLIALEFTRAADEATKAPARETWGIRLQFSSADAAPAQTYFCVPERLEYAALAPEGKLLTDDAFRAWLRREYGNESLFNRQRDYLEEMASPRHLNFDLWAFQRTFPKAIAFELEDNVEKFIREFILEASPLDVREVRASLQAYDDTRKRLAKQEDEAEFLRRIGAHHDRYVAARREEAILQHVGRTLRLRQAEELQERHRAELQRLEADHADDLKKLASARSESADLAKLIDDVRFEIAKDPDGATIGQLDRQKRELGEKVRQLREAQQSVHQRLDERHYRWCQWLKHGEALPLAGLKESLQVDDALLIRLRSGADSERLSAMVQLAAQFSEIWSQARELVRPVEDSLRTAQARLQQLAEDLENLGKGRAPGVFPVFQAIRQKLGDRAEQLGRLIEVKPEAERWWPALEWFLGRNRWTIVVDGAADYREALEILRKTAPGREAESLLNPAEARQLARPAHPDSLFSKVEVGHPAARPYVEHLLGDVLCVETVEALEKAEAGRAITPEGLLKQVPLRRRLKPAATVELTLGREGLQRMRAVKQREQVETRTEFDALQRRLSDVHAWLDLGRQGGLGDAGLPDRAAELGQLPQLQTELERTQATLELLLTPEREARQKRYAELESRKIDCERRIGSLLAAKEQFEFRAKPHREALNSVGEEIQAAQLDVEQSRVELSRRFSGILDSELSLLRDQIRAEVPKWTDCFARLGAAQARHGQIAVESQQKRNHERQQLASVRDSAGNLRHPEYQGEFDHEDDDNRAWSARLEQLEQVELAQSRQLAADRQREWERRLEENVLNELNRRLSDATNTVRLLDRYLSQPVGRYRYRISQRKDLAGYGAIWSLLDSGLEPTDPLAAAIREGEVQQAKEELMRAVQAADGADERARRLLDYRHYHHYDIDMVPFDHPEAPPISLSRAGRSLSGGESQAPFFISMLAAFRRVYDRGDRGSSRAQQLGLVVMDEAFSKLSGDGIEDCLALARSFQLQLIMAFPPERLGVMVPHARTVVICRKEVEHDRDGYVTNITNVPLLATMAEAMDALS